MPRPTLVGLSYSPWTQRARWALEHHHLGYDYREYLPVLGEPRLRIETGRLRGRVSVPALVTPHGSIVDSLAIARHADRLGDGSPLCEGHEEAVARWVELAEGALHAARSLVIGAVERDPEAQVESVKLPVPDPIKGPIARFGSAALRWKWGARATEAEGEEAIARVLDSARDAIGGGGYADRTFSFADVVLAGVVQCVLPVADRFIPLGPATRRAWTRPRLAARYEDVVAWRDALFEKHR
jgi:glutathione S-transferase